MTTKSKALGSGLEKRVVDRARKRSVSAARQPGSGVFADYPNDVAIYLPDGFSTLLVECKVRSTLPSLAQMLEWLAYVETNAKKHGYIGGTLVFNQKGSRAPKVMLDLDLFLDLLAKGR